MLRSSSECRRKYWIHGAMPIRLCRTSTVSPTVSNCTANNSSCLWRHSAKSCPFSCVYNVQSAWSCLWSEIDFRNRVARLAFLRPNSRNLAFLKVVWHEKMVFGMHVIVWHFFGLFWWCWHEKTMFGVVWNLWLSCCCRLGIKNFSQDRGPLFSTTVPFSKIQAALPSKWRHRQKTWYFFGQDFENCGTLYSVLSGADCAVFGK